MARKPLLHHNKLATSPQEAQMSRVLYAPSSSFQTDALAQHWPAPAEELHLLYPEKT
eukprot:CAMPEP_0179083838 /NCGR_PEP_ID=MMETSP0796-20121207/37881_1 /TAXON_ID=73915 /ORGANISM="Pyrodinium bahamense, Strain pbaha01" /LENGTH=56 /DNA_ID=CAMNT_0020781251 /DNA_START=13 /DNA_END=183 /DNA_ORIENTATION=+